MQFLLLTLIFFLQFIYSLQDIMCKNGGVPLSYLDGSQKCFCYATGYYGTLCELECPSEYPIECIVV